jgi:hypothetical protein
MLKISSACFVAITSSVSSNFTSAANPKTCPLCISDKLGAWNTWRHGVLRAGSSCRMRNLRSPGLVRMPVAEQYFGPQCNESHLRKIANQDLTFIIGSDVTHSVEMTHGSGFSSDTRALAASETPHIVGGRSLHRLLQIRRLMRHDVTTRLVLALPSR